MSEDYILWFGFGHMVYDKVAGFGRFRANSAGWSTASGLELPGAWAPEAFWCRLTPQHRVVVSDLGSRWVGLRRAQVLVVRLRDLSFRLGRLSSSSGLLSL